MQALLSNIYPTHIITTRKLDAYRIQQPITHKNKFKISNQSIIRWLVSCTYKGPKHFTHITINLQKPEKNGNQKCKNTHTYMLLITDTVHSCSLKKGSNFKGNGEKCLEFWLSNEIWPQLSLSEHPKKRGKEDKTEQAEPKDILIIMRNREEEIK